MNERFYLLKIQLLDIEPVIWRRFAVPASITLDRLHDIIQIVMGWTDSHLHEFTIGNKRYTEYPESKGDGLVCGRYRLGDLIKQKGRTFRYLYDFGDSSLGIGCSTLNKWIVKARNQEFDLVSADEINRMTKEKRPQDWTLEERLNIAVTCGSLSDEKLGEYCREQGIYPHHVKQWKLDFISGNTVKGKAVSPSELKILRHENKALKKELNRKDRALAETAALLVLQKKSPCDLGKQRGQLTMKSERLEIIVSFPRSACECILR